MKNLTMRNTVAEIKEALAKASLNKAVKADKNLYSRMVYTSGAIKKGEKIKKSDLLDLLQDCDACIIAYAEEQTKQKEAKKTQKATPKGEASVKKAPTKKSEAEAEPKKQTASKEELKKTQAKEKPAKKETASKKPEPKGQTKTKPEKKTPAKKSEVKPIFPESFEDEEGKYTLAKDILTLEDLRNALENDEDIILAAHWTPEAIKEGLYGFGQLPKTSVPKKFDRDLDLSTVVYAGERLTTFITVSQFTEAAYSWTEKSLKPTAKGRKGKQLSYELYRYEEK